MRVLVTRAEKASQKTAAHLLALGHEPVLLPLARPVHTPQNALTALAKPHSSLIITSTEALRALESIQEQLTPHFSTPLFVVGAATAKAAQRLGFLQLETADGDGTALAELLGKKTSPNAAPLLYLAGTPRAKALERGLNAQALSVETAEVYRMETIAYLVEDIVQHLDHKPIDAVLLYSAETARRFCALPIREKVAELFASLRCFCLSQQVAKSLAEPFNSNISIAQKPDEESLLALLNAQSEIGKLK
ncbi:uroporphyrinogen-III synthase [Rhizobium sp.]|uniref:uroporphyrinogen-III synthase n=1 Tax=Rhizobium sp. TaxID=391 RepID=UPI000E85D87D|nr:uroporphyrinogen III synthase [Rhizobium sp.]